MIRDYRIANIGVKRHPSLGYRHYLVYGFVEGAYVSAMTTNSQIFDFWNDEDSPVMKRVAVGWIKHILINAYYDQLQEGGAL